MNQLDIEQTFPLLQLNQLAEQEGHNKHFYRPATYVHKWWARRLGSVFRTILLATFLPPGENAYQYRHTDFGGVYLHRGLSLMECLTPWLVVRRVTR